MADDSDKTVADIFELFGGPSAFARTFGLKGSSTASEMKRRGFISVDLWPAIVAIAEQRKIAWLTYERLTLMHARKPLQPAGVLR